MPALHMKDSASLSCAGLWQGQKEASRRLNLREASEHFTQAAFGCGLGHIALGGD